ncbi:uncharacterized protein LOC128143933 [Harpia harpyja]|uniref:uncharacterized protein LOC128143933 n=1 Tax=Harpia harpyja TaxID=202280 RepID=UPI0022B08B31|nr:uncharacterized protein LOC128143933 [Harpia harpyja]
MERPHRRSLAPRAASPARACRQNESNAAAPMRPRGGTTPAVSFRPLRPPAGTGASGWAGSGPGCGDCAGCSVLPCLTEKLSLPGKASWAIDKTRLGPGSAARPSCTAASALLLMAVTMDIIHCYFTAPRSLLRGITNKQVQLCTTITDSSGFVGPAGAPMRKALRFGSCRGSHPDGATRIHARAGLLHACAFFCLYYNFTTSTLVCKGAYYSNIPGHAPSITLFYK